MKIWHKWGRAPKGHEQWAFKGKCGKKIAIEEIDFSDSGGKINCEKCLKLMKPKKK